jgi:hypothetical protein
MNGQFRGAKRQRQAFVETRIARLTAMEKFGGLDECGALGTRLRGARRSAHYRQQAGDRRKKPPWEENGVRPHCLLLTIAPS